MTSPSTWDASNPNDNEKISRLGTVIRPNWQAIQIGDSTFQPQAMNFANRTAVTPAIAVDPTAITNAYIVYSKTDGSGNTELFGIGPTSGAVQLTKGTPINGSSGSTYIPGGMILKWGQFTVATHHTNVLFASAFPTAIQTVLVSPFLGAPTGAYYVTAWTTCRELILGCPRLPRCRNESISHRT